MSRKTNKTANASAKAPSKTSAKTAKVDGSAGVWGCRPGSQAAALNAAIVNANGPVTAKGLATSTGFSVGRIGSHLQSLVWRGYLGRNPQGAGYVVVSQDGVTLAQGRAQHAAQMAAKVVAPVVVAPVKADKPAKGKGKGSKADKQPKAKAKVSA